MSVIPSSFRRALVLLSVALTGSLSLVAISSPAGAASSAPSNWVQVGATLSGPSARYDASMAYDTATGTTVLFGGYNGSYLAETWTWNGSAWTKLSPATSPPPMRGATMVYDDFTHDIVLFGGLSSTGPLSDTWTFDGTTWTKLLATGPAARSGATMVYDSATHDVVLFGGKGASGALSDTWLWTGTSWTSPTSTTPPPPARFGASMAYDAAANYVILYGGEALGSALGDTWTFDGTNWTQATAASPPARYNAAMVYDAASSDVVLFSGTDGTSSLAQTWIWNGTYWNSQVSSSPPSPRYEASMTYNPVADSAVLFGGYDGTTSYSDTWNFDVVPGMPPTVKATSNANGQSVVTWTAPTSNGGSTILGYSVVAVDATTAANGSQTCSTTGALTCSVTGLTNGDHYTFSVSAISGIGTGASTSSNVVIPATAPGIPAITAVTAGSGQVTVTWSAPTSTGGTPIASYRVITHPGGAFCHVPGKTTSCRIAGLRNGSSYAFTITATNAAGTSLSSLASASVRPRTLPSAPVITSTSVSGNDVTVRWTPPVSNGGVRLSGYSVFAGSTPGGEGAQPLATLSYHSFSFVFRARAGQSVYVFVRATNVAGSGPHSNQVVAVAK